MKKSLVARGITGIVASLLGVAAVGCGADVGDGAAGDSAEIGSSEQAISINTTHMHTPSQDSVTYNAVYYPSVFNLDANNAVVMGGFGTVNGAGVTSIKKFAYSGGTNTGTWSDALDNSSNVQTVTQRGDSVLIKVPGTSNYLLIGGRSSDSAGSEINTIDLIQDLGSGKVLVTKAAGTLATKRVYFTAMPCGSSKVLVAGGLDDSGNTLDSIEVLSVSGTTVTAAALQDDATPAAHTITLKSARKFHGALSFGSDLELRIVGGNDGSSRIATTEKIKVNSSCVMDHNTTVTDALNGTFHPAVGTSMPAAREKFVFAPVGITISAVGYEGLVAAGTNGSLQTSTFAYDVDNDAWTNTNTPSLTAGQLRPAFAQNSGNTQWALIGGFDGSNNSLTVTNIFTNSGAGSFASPQSLDTSRLGPVAAYLGSTPDDETGGATDGIEPVVFFGQDTSGPTLIARPE